MVSKMNRKTKTAAEGVADLDSVALHLDRVKYKTLFMITYERSLGCRCNPCGVDRV